MLAHLLNVAMLTAGIIFASAVAIINRDAAAPIPVASATRDQVELPSLDTINRAERCAVRPAICAFGV